MSDAHLHDQTEVAPGDENTSIRLRVIGYLVGLGLAILFTAVSFFVAGTDLVWAADATGDRTPPPPVTTPVDPPVPPVSPVIPPPPVQGLGTTGGFKLYHGLHGIMCRRDGEGEA